jgi:hypothetical protein
MVTVLFVSYHFAPENLSGTHRSLHFARALKDAGHRVLVAAPPVPRHPKGGHLAWRELPGFRQPRTVASAHVRAIRPLVPLPLYRPRNRRDRGSQQRREPGGVEVAPLRLPTCLPPWLPAAA